MSSSFDFKIFKQRLHWSLSRQKCICPEPRPSDLIVTKINESRKKKGGGGKNIGKEHWNSVNTSMHGIWNFEEKKNEDFKLNLIWFSITKTFNEIKLMLSNLCSLKCSVHVKCFQCLYPALNTPLIWHWMYLIT